MTSIGPYSQSYNFTHMFSIEDNRRARKQAPVYSPTTLMGIINTNSNFKRFKYIIQLAEMDGIYNDDQANFTLFIPTDTALSYLPESFFTEMDRGTARQIINYSTLNYYITSELIEDSAASYYNTLHKVGKLFVSNINGITYLNNSLNTIKNDIKIIKKDILASNGIIHATDGLLKPYII